MIVRVKNPVKTIDPKVYTAKIINFERILHAHYGRSIKWTLKILSPTVGNVELIQPFYSWFFTGDSEYFLNNKLSRFLRSCGHWQLKNSAITVDLSSFIEKNVQVVVKNAVTKTGTFSKIKDFFPAGITYADHQKNLRKSTKREKPVPSRSVQIYNEIEDKKLSPKEINQVVLELQRLAKFYLQKSDEAETAGKKRKAAMLKKQAKAYQQEAERLLKSRTF